jgi:hypothetical protein
MKVYEKLLEVGLTCPICGGKVSWIPNVHGEISFLGCCATIEYEGVAQIQFVMEWILLTGGPVPGKIKPPKDMIVATEDRFVLFDRRMKSQRTSGWVMWPDGALSGAPITWWLLPKYRTEAYIRPWLESEVE